MAKPAKAADTRATKGHSEGASDGASNGKPARRATAESMASRQREISVSEFFTKNRHLLGFDNPAKALLTTVKEAVDNSLDACEEAGILPDIKVEIREVADGRYRVAIEDNGPGIVKPQIPKIFAKLLYGSKFHRLKQSRGQQGIGISAAGLYGQLTTGKAVTIVSKTGKGRPAYRIELRIDTKRNQPDVVAESTVDWDKEHGTRVEIELTGAYRGGRTGVEAYLEQTVVANPHLALTFQPPKAEMIVFPRVAHELPREAQEIKPHPHGVELGMLLNMLQDSPGKTVKQVLVDDFSRVSPAVADEICKAAKVSPRTPAASVHGDDLERLHKALGEVKVMAPPASCVVPIGEELLIEGLKRRFKAEFYVSTTRPPSVYRGNPFVVEVGLAYGGELPNDDPADIMRFANRVPLQYQPKACAISESVYQTNWKAYQLPQPKGSLPVGPLAIVVHLASVWVPFTSEAKEAVAHYDELLREMRLAVQECGRKLGTHLRARAKAESEQKRLSLFQRYIPEVAAAIASILGTDKNDVETKFVTALPNFVRIGELQEAEGGGDGGGEPAPGGGSEGGAAAASAAPRGKASKRAKREIVDEPEEPAKPAAVAKSAKAAKPAPAAKSAKPVQSAPVAKAAKAAPPAKAAKAAKAAKSSAKPAPPAKAAKSAPVAKSSAKPARVSESAPKSPSRRPSSATPPSASSRKPTKGSSKPTGKSTRRSARGSDQLTLI
jgi:DNA topoisomerase-6 subunit B